MLRVATWHGDFSRKGPGVLVRELSEGTNLSALAPIIEIGPDVLLLTDFDFDASHAALGLIQDRLNAQGLNFAYRYANRPNTGRGTGVDVDRDGRLGGPRDAQGFGWFSGQGGMAVLSRYPLNLERDLTDLLWIDAPNTKIAAEDPAHDVQRLSSSAHWALRVSAPFGEVLLCTLAATPPVFDGPEDRNGRRNHDEVLLWAHMLDSLPDLPLVLIGNFNLDPDKGEGLHQAMQKVLALPRIRDPMPGKPTVDWESTGPLRVSYVLPDRAFALGARGVARAPPETGPHGLVWVDLSLP